MSFNTNVSECHSCDGIRSIILQYWINALFLAEQLWITPIIDVETMSYNISNFCHVLSTARNSKGPCILIPRPKPKPVENIFIVPGNSKPLGFVRVAVRFCWTIFFNHSNPAKRKCLNFRKYHSSRFTLVILQWKIWTSSNSLSAKKVLNVPSKIKCIAVNI